MKIGTYTRLRLTTKHIQEVTLIYIIQQAEDVTNAIWKNILVESPLKYGHSKIF